MIAKRTNKNRRLRGRERGVVLIAVLMFVAMILPVTLLILDTVRIESLLPVNEAYTRTAGDEADKGFAEALAAIMEDQDSRLIDINVDPSDPGYIIRTDPDSASGKHDYDYLAERWARHPDNNTVFLLERSLENWNGANSDEHTVPARWQLQNVPFGMDDFGEFYNDTDFPRLLQPAEFANGSGEAPAYYVDPSESAMIDGPHDTQPVSRFASDDLANGAWQLSPADPNYYTNLANLRTIEQFIPRPASYFRNTSGNPSTGLGSVGLPQQYADAPAGGEFIQENNNAFDSLV